MIVPKVSAKDVKDRNEKLRRVIDESEGGGPANNDDDRYENIVP